MDIHDRKQPTFLHLLKTKVNDAKYLHAPHKWLCSSLSPSVSWDFIYKQEKTYQNKYDWF